MTSALTAQATATVVSLDPASPSNVVTSMPQSTAADAVSAVDAASEAARAWAAQSAGHRARVLGCAADILWERADELARLICREEGKLLTAAKGEVSKTVEQFRLSAQLAYLVEGTTYPQEAVGVAAWTIRVPLGVVVAITPWNFPVSLAARKIAPALAAGNAVVFKPSPVAAASGAFLADVCHRAGVPEEVLPVVHGDLQPAMAALVGHRKVRAVTFTGSDRTGGVLRRTANVSSRLQFEMGGHNAALVCADADPARAAREVSAGAFGLTGQVCTATDRVFVERRLAGQFTELLRQEVERLTVGRGDDPGAQLGPVATLAQQRRLSCLLDSARAAGAQVIAQGALAAGLDPSGYWVRPTLLADVPADHPVNTAEIFGPLLSVVPVDSPREAIEAIGADDHRLVTAVHTDSLATAGRFLRDVRHGIVKINERTTGNGVAPPFGGWGASSSGAFPEGGRGGLDFVTDTMTVYCNYQEA